MSIEEVLDKFQVMRRERIRLIANELKEKRVVDLNFFLGKISVGYGVRRKTGMEYLEDLEASGKIKIVNDKISWIKDVEPSKSTARVHANPKIQKF